MADNLDQEERFTFVDAARATELAGASGLVFVLEIAQVPFAGLPRWIWVSVYFPSTIPMLTIYGMFTATVQEVWLLCWIPWEFRGTRGYGILVDFPNYRFLLLLYFFGGEKEREWN